MDRPTDAPGEGPAPAIPDGAPIPAGAGYAVAVLTAMNLLNYLDRYVPSELKDLIKADLHLSDKQTSFPLTSFIFVYMLASPVIGSLADRVPRRILIASGVAVWSLATGAAYFASGFWTFLLARAMVGVGEAAYATIAPALISDFYPPDRRNRVLTIFYAAMPVGAAMGYVLGGALGAAYGWRVAFLACGLPGVLTALLALRIRDPGKGRFDDGKPAPVIAWPEAVRRLMRNPAYLYTVGGYAAVTFAIGGMADWIPAFLSRHRGMTVEEAGRVVGAVTVIGGIAGTAVGGLLADRLRRWTRNPYLALSAIALVPATVFAAAALLVEGKTAVALCILLAQFFLWFYNGPINAMILNSVPPALRIRAFAFSILAIHLLGDALSPPLIGAISDAGDGGHLPLALALVPATLAVGCAVWAIGWRRLPDPAIPAAAE